MTRADYGQRRDYAKIDIYLRRPHPHGPMYVASTTWARSLKEAREQYALDKQHAAASDYRAVYARKGS